MNIYANIKKLCDEKGITTYKLCKDLGFSTALMSQWKSGRQNPSGKKMRAMAEYFGVPVEYLYVGDYEPEKEAIWQEAMQKEDREVNELLEALKNNPGMRVLFSKTKNASREDIEKVIKMLEIMRGEDFGGYYC